MACVGLQPHKKRNQTVKNKVAGLCSMHGGKVRRINSFGVQTGWKETTWEAQA